MFLREAEHRMIDVFDDLKFYFKYASSAYDIVCPSPNGNVLVDTVCTSRIERSIALNKFCSSRMSSLILKGSLLAMIRARR